ncbi:hypothetical protein CCY01nite_42950 [Chitinophaga cymbidii]|uniref:Cytochrome c domain-containing protein n=2 Tax=Chitinophaga cymbidii TaxID=1096750 RepID=A0A512RQR8_9BACT|nr:hypothetical protein CCY01nite_42950 [Chitinophaga cymbidii]
MGYFNRSGNYPDKYPAFYYFPSTKLPQNDTMNVRSLWVAAALILVACTNTRHPETSATDPRVAKLKLPEGFHADHLYSPSDNGQGSWVSMTFDDKGRMIVSDQYGALYRLELPPVGADSSAKPKIENLGMGTDTIPGTDSVRQKVSMGYAQGLLYAFNSLYVMVNHRSNDEFDKGSGLYRLQDTDGDDQFDKITLLKALNGEGEHGPHSVVLSPDKQSIYVIAGNHTDIPPMDAYRLPSNWKEDNLFPLIVDPNGHAANRKAPGGWIAKVDPDGSHWELISAGFRNPFDLAFNDAGEMFVYDSDMEWDIGLPWYRPTRICHATSGSEFGWRTGNSKWSPAYPDNLPAILNIGQGSPTNVIYGGNARFPEKYRRSLFAFDWSFGIIYAVQLEPDGASYRATGEEFVSGSSLPLTDGVIGPDGALYFLTGGRRLESDLYRVYYGDNTGNTETLQAEALTEDQQIRKKLEQYHGKAQNGAVDVAWPYLKHNDRFIRYAARIALEHQPVAEWQERALAEKDPVIIIQSAIALARQGQPAVKDRLLQQLMSVHYQQLSGPQQVDILRAFELVLSRMGKPSSGELEKITAYLGPHYPAPTNELNRMLSKVLVYLEAPDAVKKTVALLETAKDDSTQHTMTASSDLIMRNPQYGMTIASVLSKVPPAQQTYYANVLTQAKTGWTPELQEAYFSWFYKAFSYKGGFSFIGYIDKARKLALQHVPKDRFDHFNIISGDSLLNTVNSATASMQPKGPGRNWKVDEALKTIDELSFANSNFERGKAMFTATLCASCHSMQGEGGIAGPDLTQLGSRFSNKDILESIIEPSKTISDQYGATVFYLKSGGTTMGRLVNQDETQYYISQNPFAPLERKEVSKANVLRTRVSEVSPMLPGMINTLNPEELRDLLAYLKAGGNPKDTIYSIKEKK